MRVVATFAIGLFSAVVASQQASTITTAGVPAQLDIRAAGSNSLRVTLKPAGPLKDGPIIL